MSALVHIVNLSEISALRLLITNAMGRTFCIFDVDPILPISRPSLERLARWARMQQHCIECAESAHWAKTLRQDPNLFFRQDLYADIEPWLEKRFAFARWQPDHTSYARPF